MRRPLRCPIHASRARIEHGLRELLAQRLYGLCCGYEDLNDHRALRDDVLMQTAVGRDEPLASAPTFSRLDNRATRAQAWALHEVLIEQFIASHKRAPEELVLDIDASDVPLHGQQERGEFHAYYDEHCYLPLYVFCGQAMLACLLAAQQDRRGQARRGRDQAAGDAAAPGVARRRGSSCAATRAFAAGACCRWCERSDVGYVIGLARNARLHAAVEYAEAALADAYAAQRHQAAADRRVRLRGQELAARAARDHAAGVRCARHQPALRRHQPRRADPVQLYERLYCQRGEAENRIKEAQLDLFGTRASCPRFVANQFRLLLAALAYTLMERLRELALKATELERARAATIRCRLLKIGAAVLRNTRRVRVMLASHHPLRELFAERRPLAALGP